MYNVNKKNVPGGHRDNPNAVQFRGAYRQVVVDSPFVPSKNKNCIEDMDSTLLRLNNLSQKTPHLSALKTSNEASPALANLTPLSIVAVLINIEYNIATYLAGYLVNKTLQIYPCDDFRELWQDKVIKGTK